MSTPLTWILLPAPIYVPLLIWFFRRAGKQSEPEVTRVVKSQIEGEEEKTNTSPHATEQQSTAELLSVHFEEHVPETHQFPAEGLYILKMVSKSTVRFEIHYINTSGTEQIVILNESIVRIRPIKSGKNTVVFRNGEAKCNIRFEDIADWGI